MSDLFPMNHWKSALVLLLPALIVTGYLALVVDYSLDFNDGYLGALLDDTWIHVRYAMSIAEGRGLSYNAGEVTTGATSPLWVLILGAVYAVTNPGLEQQVHIAVGLSALGHILTVLAVTGFGWSVTRRVWIGLLAGVITAVTGRLIWMGLSGMETTLFTTLSILALWSHITDMRDGRVFGWRTGIITALATLARPEGYLLAALIGLDAVFIAPKILDGGGSVWQRFRAAWRGMIAYILLAGSYPLVCLLLTGHPLPNTFRVKSQLGNQWPDLPRSFLWTPNVDQGPFLIILAGLGIGYMLWRARQLKIGIVWILWPVIFVLAVLFIGPDNFSVTNARYVAPAIPFHALAAAIGVSVVMDLLTGQIDISGLRSRSSQTRLASAQRFPVMSKVGAGSLAVVLVVMTLIYGLNPNEKTRNQAWRVAQDTAQLRAMHVTAGEWFDAHTEPGDLIALNDVGAIVHISDQPVLDMVGLVSPEVIDATQDQQPGSCPHDLQLARLMLDQPPVLIGVFPLWFPCLTIWPGALQAFDIFTISGPTVIGGGELVVYWPLWENWPVHRVISPTAIPISAPFEQGITLGGYQTEAVEGGLRVSLWWRIEAPPGADYTVFVHLIDANDEIISQHDSRPQEGHFNTAWWQAGDIIRDRHTISVNDQTLLEQDELRLRIGLYPTGGGPNLMRVDDQQDYVILPLGAPESNREM